MLKKWWDAVLDVVFPPRCPVCSEPVPEHGLFCPQCLAKVLSPRRLNVVSRRMTALADCWVLCEYSAGVKSLLRSMKFRQATKFGQHLSRLLDEYLDLRPLAAVEVVVPVPLHYARQAERGFNQSEIIYRRWATEHGWQWADCLERKRPTVPQWQLSRQERRQNIKGAFQATRPELIRGKTVLLVDDVVTTGITMNECAKVLRKYGAAKVVGLAVASGASLSD